MRTTVPVGFAQFQMLPPEPALATITDEGVAPVGFAGVLPEQPKCEDTMLDGMKNRISDLGTMKYWHWARRRRDGKPVMRINTECRLAVRFGR